MGGTSVALSGGGHRASLFGLGALMALVDTGEHTDVTSITSVSGVSLTNGWLATNLVFPDNDSQAFQAQVKPFVRTLANKGTFLSHHPGRRTGLIVGIVLAHGAFFLPLGRWGCYGVYVGALTFVAVTTMAPAFITLVGK